MMLKFLPLCCVFFLCCANSASAYFIQSSGKNGNIPLIGSIENLDKIIAGALPLTMESTMSQLFSRPMMGLNQPLMVEIPDHVLNPNTDPSQFRTMPLHKCKYCSEPSKTKGNSGGLMGPAGFLKRRPTHGKTRPQMRQYPTKGGYGLRSNKLSPNPNIILVVLHMNNEKVSSNNYGGTKG